MSRRTYIIAEAGVNHNGDSELAKKLILEAKQAGADCVKFQTFKAKQIVTKHSPKATYQLKVTDQNESQFEMLKKLELDFEVFKELIALCKQIKIDFLSTPYNLEDIDFLEELGVNGYKIASGQLTELSFLKAVAKKNKKIILSTGMGNLSDVYNAVEAIKSTGNNNLVVLQCTTNYPSRIEDANILAMNTIKESCDVRIGYSDHVTNNYACYASVALGAEIVEKHFTLDKTMEGPDHSCSLNPKEFKELVDGIRNIEKSLGNKVKKPSPIEIENSKGMKRGMVVLKSMKPGDIFNVENIGFKRPFRGIPIKEMDLILGKKVAKKMEEDDFIDFDSVQW